VHCERREAPEDVGAVRIEITGLTQVEERNARLLAHEDVREGHELRGGSAGLAPLDI
jgi:hypothetical protein